MNFLNLLPWILLFIAGVICIVYRIKEKERTSLFLTLLLFTGSFMMAFGASHTVIYAYAEGYHDGLGNPASELPIGQEYQIIFNQRINGEENLLLIRDEKVVYYRPPSQSVDNASPKDWIINVQTSEGPQLRIYPHV